MNTTIYYLLNEEGRRKSLLSGGDGKYLQSLKTDDRQALEMADVDKKGNAFLFVGFKRIDYQGNPDGVVDMDVELKEFSEGKPYWKETSDQHFFSEPMTAENLLIWETARRFQVEFSKTKYQAEFDAKMEAYKKKEAEERAQYEKEEAAKEVEKEAKDRLNKNWIDTHGSVYLKMAVGMGYNCQRRYVEERSAFELDGFVVDFDDDIKYRSRSCPSYDALLETKDWISKGFDARVIWLTKGIEDDEDFEECEAILIENYLGKYDCIKLS